MHLRTFFFNFSNSVRCLREHYGVHCDDRCRPVLLNRQDARQMRHFTGGLYFKSRNNHSAFSIQHSALQSHVHTLGRNPNYRTQTAPVAV
jgi:hypothetical protein